MPEGLGAEGASVTVQAEPSQCSTKEPSPATLGMTLGRKLLDSALGPANPTAQQSDALVQVTELNWS